MRIITFCSIGLIASVATLTVNAQRAGYRLPANAQLIEDGAYYLGRARDWNGKEVEGIAFVHPRPGAAKGGGKPPGGGTSSCYSLLASGARWKSPEPYVVDASGATGLTENTVIQRIGESLDEWESHVSSEIFLDGTTGTVDPSSIGKTMNSKNEFVFDEIADRSVIAVTFVWGVFRGPAQTRELVEWDMIFDDAEFDFADLTTAGGSSMDFSNIFQHESGHAAGLAHPSNSCTEETMYAYAAAGEIKKRTLEQGDIEGIKALYP
jgi:hypothetical protein